MKDEFLKLIGFGTDGSDGIEPGVHLRWGFDHKLGFPHCFKLYRRKSDLKNKYEFPIPDDVIPKTLKIPFDFQLRQNETFRFRLASAVINEQEVDTLQVGRSSLEDGSTIRVIHIRSGEVTFRFSKPVSRIELRFLIEAASDFTIEVLSPDGGYSAYPIHGHSPGLQNLSFDAPEAAGIKLSGTAIKLAWLAAWRCVDAKGWQWINDLCGCGLPVNQEGTPYVNDVYPPLLGRDLATALCRLGYRRVEGSPITAAGFLELKAMLLTMTGEGSEVPVGWTLFPNDEGEAAGQTVEVSKYDFLLAESLQVFFARMLDLYCVDTDAEIDTPYDYKVTAEWPESNKRRLEHEITFEGEPPGETFFPVHPLDDHTVLYAPGRPQIVEAPYALFRTELGLQLTAGNSPVVINFLKPVTEVQLVLVNPDFAAGNTVVVEAYQHLHSAWVDREELSQERGMLRLRAEQIDYIKIHATQATLCRLHYDFEPYPVGLQETIICGVFRHTHLPLTQPGGLIVSCLPGGTVTDQDGNVREQPYIAGLRWDVNADPQKDLISIAPVLYHIEKRPEGGGVELLTGDSPLFVAPPVIKNNARKVPIGWPKERQYLTEEISRATQNDYRVAAMDLFGRQSAFTGFETYAFTSPKPPPPTGVTAQFLDYSTYNPADNSFADSTINDADKAWLRVNRKNAIVVRWNWTENLQLQAPDVEGFNVHFKQGWLNTYTGLVVTAPVEELLAKSSLNLTQTELEKYAIFEETPEDIPVYRFQVSFDTEPPPPIEPVPPPRGREREYLPADMFRLCWLTQGNHSFLILKNDGRRQPSLWVLKFSDTPIKDKGFGIAVTPEKPFFIDYKDPEQWTDNRVSHLEPKDARASYTVYIEEPAFPNPALEAADVNKVRYAQIGVNSYVENVEGSVSPPATIMAIFRTPPAAPAAFVPAGPAVTALKATPANVHGKSSFALRWDKTHTALKHHVYRALDDTLFVLDNQQRRARDHAIYEDFKAAHPEFDPADVEAIQGIVYQPNPQRIAQNYAGLTPRQLQTLASLPDNQGAFTQITAAAIDENDPAFEDRITEIPDPLHGAPYTPNPANISLYVDETLNGRGSNRYFYALKTIDTNGLASPLSLATLPVECPKTTPPPAPVLTSVLGGENQITIRWAKNPGADIAGYLLFRTPERQLAKDWRRMELIKTNAADLFTVAVDGTLPQREFEFIDASVTARQAYYYGLVAVGLDETGKWLKSRLSQVVTGQAYKTKPPDPPTIHRIEWIRSDADGNVFDFDESIPDGETRFTAVRLEWIADDSELVCMVQFSAGYLDGFQNASGWLAAGRYDFIHRNSHPNYDYSYRIKVMDPFGNMNTEFEPVTLPAQVS